MLICLPTFFCVLPWITTTSLVVSVQVSTSSQLQCPPSFASPVVSAWISTYSEVFFLYSLQAPGTLCGVSTWVSFTVELSDPVPLVQHHGNTPSSPPPAMLYNKLQCIKAYRVHFDACSYIVSDSNCMQHYGTLFFCLIYWLFDRLKKVLVEEPIQKPQPKWNIVPEACCRSDN